MIFRFSAHTTFAAFALMFSLLNLLGCTNEPQIHMDGELGEFASSILLTQAGSQFQGTFEYTDSSISRRKIQLSGGLVANVLTLQELGSEGSEVPGVFIGRFDGQTFKGNWQDASGESNVPFEFRLIEQQEERDSIADRIKEIAHKPEVPLITYEMYGEGLFPNSNGRIRATCNGRVFEDITGDDTYVKSEDYVDPAYRLILAEDLDGDGFQEALIEDGTGSGASRCALRFFICNYNPVKKKFEMSNFFGSSCPTPEIVTRDGKKLIKIVINRQGFDQTEMIEHTEFHHFDGSSVKLVESVKTTPIPAVDELLASYYTEENSNEEISLEVDLNNDGRMDQIRADYWFRWGLLNWNVYLNGKSEAILSGSGKRIGVLSTSTHGVHDLVNDLNDIYFWDGTKYVGRADTK